MTSLKSENLPSTFSEIKDYLLLHFRFQLSSIPYFEAESRDYNAMRFKLNGKLIVFRQAKTTPNKQGQFVTLWKRPTPDSKIMPFEPSDNIDFCLIATFSGKQKGIFLLDSHTLIAKGVFSTSSKEGKRAIRVYPTWESPTSKQAIQTQKWQSLHFVDFNNQEDAIARFKYLFENNNNLS
ncbi:MepB family protein [Xenorhabdus koppenhoeferi]|uniref:MepB family protein n=1 Tax=Xenorhabdus koppenhoeferi TaxID=351659 RepID=UPI002B4063DB|nr:MepB family protein [Xenorhabdus sp. Vera]